MPQSCHGIVSACIAALLAVPAMSQPPQAQIERQLLLRDQQQHELLLKQRQSQELLDPKLSATQRLEIERRQLQQRQQQRRLHDSQAQRQMEVDQGPQPQPPGGSRQQAVLDVQRRQFDKERQDQLKDFKRDAKPPPPAAFDP